MATVTASVTRSDLGLGDLNINDHTNYVMTNEILGGTVAWDRTTVSSPYVNGDVTVHRRRGSVQERVSIYVYGTNQTNLRDNVNTLIDAFNQDNFNLTISLDSIAHTYQCESSDHTIEWANTLMHSNMVKVTFDVIRKPIALAGF